MLSRRDFIRNSSSLLLIPAYVKAESLMRVCVPKNPSFVDIQFLPFVERWICPQPLEQWEIEYINSLYDNSILALPSGRLIHPVTVTIKSQEINHEFRNQKPN